jgi:putative endonuclease
MKKKEVGNWGEEQARKYLIKNGYQILEQNYRCPLGEVDIICRSPKDILVFVEVKTRRSLSFGSPMEAVGIKKQHRIIKSSMFYIQQKKLYNKVYRFDIIDLYLTGLSTYQLNHYPNAFQLRDTNIYY